MHTALCAHAHTASMAAFRLPQLSCTRPTVLMHTQLQWPPLAPLSSHAHSPPCSPHRLSSAWLISAVSADGAVCREPRGRRDKRPSRPPWARRPSGPAQALPAWTPALPASTLASGPSRTPCPSMRPPWVPASIHRVRGCKCEGVCGGGGAWGTCCSSAVQVCPLTRNAPP